MMTKAEAAQIRALIQDAVKMGGTNYVNAAKVAYATLDRATEGRHLPKQLARAHRAKELPRCAHNAALMDWSGEQLIPPCGCRIVEPAGADGEITLIKANRWHP